MSRSDKNGRELEHLVLQKVAQVSSSIDAAGHVNEVICALHSLALRLFAVDSSALSATVDHSYRSQVLDVELPTDNERDEWWHAFYHGAAFPAIARILIYNVASRWLSSFPISAKKQVYDSFFVKGPSSEIIQALVPALMPNGTLEEFDHRTIVSNSERLLVLCLLENKGVCHMVGEFRFPCTTEENVGGEPRTDKSKVIYRIAQLLASVPDKARPEASSALSSPLFFRQIVIQLLVGLEEISVELNGTHDSYSCTPDASLLFIGETFSRICRRGSADILLAEMIPRILNHVQSCMSMESNVMDPTTLESKSKSQSWSKLMESMKDQYAVERLSEELLRQLATKSIKDTEAYWILWLLFHRTLKDQSVMRAMFVEKFIFWKVFPICCLRWIIQFAIFDCSPCAPLAIIKMKHHKTNFLDIVRRLVTIWSKSGFVQSTPMDQQAYITAAIGLCLEKMSKEELDTTKEVSHSILEGVRCRLESPIHLVRKMASSVAFVFSKVVDPKNPLYLDDDFFETVDWEFGLLPKPMQLETDPHVDPNSHDEGYHLCSEKNNAANGLRKKNSKGKISLCDNMLKESKLIASNETVENLLDEGDNVSEISEGSDDSSLQPYDLSDDDKDLKKSFSQLADICVALRKPDDPDGVERALDVAEKLVRASPDELRHNSADLVRALVHVRCSDVAIEGEEDSAEGKRQKTLTALLVTCPFESLDVITKLLYSPNVDTSQRILILDVMTEAALELADSKILLSKGRNLISDVGSQPWFIPSSRGPPGAGPWKEVSETDRYLNWSNRYERELPSKPGQVKKGKSRVWSIGTKKDSQVGLTKNRFPLYAAAFMLPVMQGFDKRRQGVDLLNRDFIVLGKLIYMLGVCMKCMAMHPEATALAPALLDMLRSREVAQHAEAYVRRSVLFAASCILMALHSSYVASALIEGNQETSQGLEWIRAWALNIAESDPDTECSMMAMKCLQLHAEMALQTSRALESASSFGARTMTNAVPSKMNDIIIPSSSENYLL